MVGTDIDEPPLVVIPARLGSTRLPGKMLREISGRPLIAHTVAAVRRGGWQAVVATDSVDVAEVSRAAGAEAVMTDSGHVSGTDRIAEVAESCGWDAHRIVVNVQGDEPLMPPALIKQVAHALIGDPDADLSTAALPIRDVATWRSPDIVKVVCDNAGHALYFSRASIPHDRDGCIDMAPERSRRHIGIYGYRVSALQELAGAPQTKLETLEKLEQLRALAIGQRISVVDACETPGPGVDVADDLARVAELIGNKETP